MLTFKNLSTNWNSQATALSRVTLYNFNFDDHPFNLQV